MPDKTYLIICELEEREYDGDEKLMLLFGSAMARRHGLLTEIYEWNDEDGDWKFVLGLEPSEFVKKIKAEKRAAAAVTPPAHTMEVSA